MKFTKRTTRPIRMGAAVAAVSLVAVATGAVSSAASAATPTKVTISVASLIPGSTKAATAAFNAQIKLFEKENPGITVKPSTYQWLGSTFAAKLAAKTLPTMFTVPFTDGRSLGQAGEIVDPARFLQLLDAHLAQLIVHLGIVDDFAQDVDVMPGVGLGRGVGEIDGALDPVTKAERLRQLHRQAVGRKVRLGVAQVLDDRAAVMALHLFLHQLHQLRGAKIHALFWRSLFSGRRCRQHGGGWLIVGHVLSNRERRARVKSRLRKATSG